MVDQTFVVIQYEFSHLWYYWLLVHIVYLHPLSTDLTKHEYFTEWPQTDLPSLMLYYSQMKKAYKSLIQRVFKLFALSHDELSQSYPKIGHHLVEDVRNFLRFDIVPVWSKHWDQIVLGTLFWFFGALWWLNVLFSNEYLLLCSVGCIFSYTFKMKTHETQMAWWL